jgi:hypothetical protein
MQVPVFVCRVAPPNGRLHQRQAPGWQLDGAP